MHPEAAKANLNAACEKMGISIAERTVHGAVIDATLCAELFLVTFFSFVEMKTVLTKRSGTV